MCVCAATGSSVIYIRTDSSRTYIRQASVSVTSDLRDVTAAQVLAAEKTHKRANQRRLAYNSKTELF